MFVGDIEDTGSTIGIETYEFRELNLFAKVDISIWDFAGQIEYLHNHQVSC